MAEATTLSELRAQKEKSSFSIFLRKRAPWLLNWKSLFYYFWAVFFLGLLWMAYSLLNNSFTQIYGWDYAWQNVEFTYQYWDMWHLFFKTGDFQLYATGTFLGSDNIGSNSFYSVFDPFLILCYILPRAWVPQTLAVATILKCALSALMMRVYLRYMGCQETTSRLGGVIYGFSGYLNFFVGFPNFVSFIFAVPMVLVGIEKVLKERKPSYLVWGLFLLGITSFFFLVVVCIWGVLYALWRYFWTLKTRTAKENWQAIGLGIGGFAVGIMLSAWVLLPSLRESTLSGRTTSIGALYLAKLISSFKDLDFPTFFGLLFSEVGGNNARELYPLAAFFFPTCNYLWLPLMGNSYDAWTSSLFVYTPFVILFFTALVSSIRRKKVSHLIAFALCCYLLLTNFAYFFFFAFTGDGYGRWYIVLIPEIIYYAAQELDRLKKEPKWVLPTGSLVSLALTIMTWVLVVLVVKDQAIAGNGYTYVVGHYYVPGYALSDGVIYSCLWMVYYQIGLVAIESVVMFYFQHKAYFWAILAGLASVEIIVCGNCSFAYGSSYSFQNSLDGGATTAQALTDDFADISRQDDSYYRSYVNSQYSINEANHFGYNGTSTFHSQYNFDVAQLARYSHITGNSTIPGTIFGGSYYTAVWSAYYGAKRFGFDQALNMKYYAIHRDPYLGSDEFTRWNNYADNVPFGSVIVSGEKNKSDFLIYRNPAIVSDDNDPSTSLIGHAVDSSLLYQAGTGTIHNCDSFYTASGYSSATIDAEIIRNESLYNQGAIIKNEDVTALTDAGFAIKEGAPSYEDFSGFAPVEYSGTKYTTNYESYLTEGGPAAFLENSALVDSVSAMTSGQYNADFDKVVYYPTSGFGNAFNSDVNGAYFLMAYPGKNTRIYMIGDTPDGKSNQLLCYEYEMIRSGNIHNYNFYAGERKNGTLENSLYGFYCPGLVRYIVFCAESSDYSVNPLTGYRPAVLPSDIRLYKMERSTYDQQVATIKSNALTNVKYWTDNFTCESHYSESRLVVTSLAYDVGWRVYAKDASGKETQLPTYKLDGGFVGFVAPEGDMTYHFFFQTQYLNEGVFIAMIGFGMYALFEGIVFLKAWRREREKLSLTIRRRKFDWKNLKALRNPSDRKRPNGP